MTTYRIYKMDLRKGECMMEMSHSEKQAMARFEDWREKYDDVAALFVVDNDGAILATNVTAEDEDEDYCEPDDLEMGFDPYEGCYTYDC